MRVGGVTAAVRYILLYPSLDLGGLPRLKAKSKYIPMGHNEVPIVRKQRISVCQIALISKNLNFGDGLIWDYEFKYLHQVIPPVIFRSKHLVFIFRQAISGKATCKHFCKQAHRASK